MYTLLGLIVFVLDIIAIVDVIKRGGDVIKQILWIALILVLPLVGMVLYFLIGRSKSGGLA